MLELMWCWYTAMTGWIASEIWRKISFENLGGGGGGGGGFKFKTEQKFLGNCLFSGCIL